MGNRVIDKYDINSEKLRDILADQKISIRRLGLCIDVSDRQIRTYLKLNKMPTYMIEAISRTLKVPSKSFADLGIVDGEALSKAVCVLALSDFTDSQICKLLNIDRFRLEGILYSCNLVPFSKKGVTRYAFPIDFDDRGSTTNLVP